MENDIKVRFENVWKSYRVYSSPADRIKELFHPSQHPLHKKVDALRDIDLVIRKGERVGILGENGSGKSTLLKLIVGVATQSSGNIVVDGLVSALLELGTGFGSELTGIENIYQYGLLHGLTQAEIETKIDDIISFSELGEAIHHNIRTYSSGMKLRLGFSCAVSIDPDIFIIDEALSVGDGYFQFKCLQKIKSMLERGVTFIYVSHNQDSVRSLCRRGLLLERGCLVMDDSASKVADQYRKRLFEKVSQGHEAAAATHSSSSIGRVPESDRNDVRLADITVDAAPANTAAIENRFGASQAFEGRVAATRAGNGAARIIDVVICEANGRVTETVPFGIDFSICVSFVVNRPLRQPTKISVDISDHLGTNVVHLNTIDAGLTLEDYGPGSKAVICFRLQNQFCPGEYLISVIASVAERHPYYPTTLNSGELYDYCIGGARFEVPRGSAIKSLWGLVHIPYSAELSLVEQSSLPSLLDEVT